MYACVCVALKKKDTLMHAFFVLSALLDFVLFLLLYALLIYLLQRIEFAFN